ncbi:MAG: thymidine phosphorylase family protein [Burkholderiaceae bacterium]|nr:thymidine phosphorylase family protein [Burkholderiaceae bacterium]MCD8516300.1 thymidine phosphorylase family protein [Burkholderiaceae bacterium]MCD8537149.1 thymidine phosphorylase family protein [Burkholderiaceae bacterium]MCD8566297.1 thymidine phosphorylase family protein [Burkholderiaceae bacterium]
MTQPSSLTYKPLGIDTLQEHVAFMHRDCHICKSEGIEAQTRVELRHDNKSVIAIVNVVHSDLLDCGEIGLSLNTEKDLDARPGDAIEVMQAAPVDSLSQLRTKIYGHRLDRHGFEAIVADIARGRYANIHIAAFLTAMAGRRANVQEVIDLTAAMVAIGERLSWGTTPVADKHCVGGLPGNRTTPIVVAIAASAGLTMPKTSSRAITSPAGTADVMEVMTPVTLGLDAMRDVVEKEGGCFVWGGSLALSPADDLMIKVARPLELDSDAQLVASVLSKKIAAGSTHAVIDIPIGPTAKVRSKEQADQLEHLLNQVAFANGLNLKVLRTDGSQPVGRGIGPALEAKDVISVLKNDPKAPNDLRERALTLAGEVLELCNQSSPGQGYRQAESILVSGHAWDKFLRICDAQGGFTEPETAPIDHTVTASADGIVQTIDNRRLARLAKLLGAPEAKTAGVVMHVRLGDEVKRGEPVFTMYAEAVGELAYASTYLDSHPPLLIETR